MPDYTNKEDARDKLWEAAQSQTPLKPRIEAQKKLQIQIAKLDGMSSKIYYSTSLNACIKLVILTKTKK